MAEQIIQDDLKAFKDEIVQDDIQIQKDYVSTIRPLVEDYIRKDHTAEEDKRFTAGLDEIIDSIEKTISDEKEIVSALRAADITVLKKHTEFDNATVLRDEPKRSKGQNDSAYFSRDSRLFTENKYLIAHPTETAENQLNVDPNYKENV